MKNLVILPLLLATITGCESMDKADTETIILPNNSKGWVIDCSYKRVSACFKAAGEACRNGYMIHERTIDINVDSKIPIEELPEAAFMPREYTPPRNREKYMVISCK
ncbi:hypothetical protein ACFL0R_07660 [Pseudomonadota bacterium]